MLVVHLKQANSLGLYKKHLCKPREKFHSQKVYCVSPLSCQLVNNFVCGNTTFPLEMHGFSYFWDSGFSWDPDDKVLNIECCSKTFKCICNFIFRWNANKKCVVSGMSFIITLLWCHMFRTFFYSFFARWERWEKPILLGNKAKVFLAILLQNTS